MILEVVRLRIKNGLEKEFEDGITASLPLFEAAKGCHGMKVVRSIEEPNVFYCLVKWDTVEDHTELFQKSPAYQQLFELIGNSIDGGVDATHCSEIAET
jgi:heme-degrading monooxygenase HmoA